MSAIEVPILMYHRIGERKSSSLVRDQYVPLALFRRQLARLESAGFVAITLDDMLARFQSNSQTDSKAVVITFDDGYESFFTDAVPVLQEFGMNATVFLVANCVGNTNRWDEAKGDVSERLMAWDQIREAQAMGFQIGAHTLNHPDLRFCDDVTASHEIGGCKVAIEDKLGQPVNWFCYPYGKHLERERRLVENAGYWGATGTDKHTNNPSTSRFELGRLNVRASTSPAYLMHKLRKVSGNG
jgi:peptidoglycan/xylan/chitin deacetylase (PgdA/CDA1 family)